MSNTSDLGHFDPNKQIKKYKLDGSTFDLIDVDRFKNTKFFTVFWYLYAWIMMILSIVLLGSDIYTCLNILVFHHWSTEEYKPYAYSVAKWIFTGCILFEFVLMAYKLIKGIHTYRTKNIALAYVNNVARLLYTLRSYNYFCLFNAIDHDNFFDWACFYCHSELSGAPQLLIADTPRQVINFLTLRYYATSEGTSNDILLNIKNIADTNITLSVILSFVVLSVVIWCIFFFKFCFAMLLYLPVMFKLREKGFKSFKKYCCTIVNERVRTLVFKNHRPKNELLELGIVDPKTIANNPLLQSTTSLNLNTSADNLHKGTNNVIRPKMAHTFASNEKIDYSNQFEMTALPNKSTTTLYDTRNLSASSLTHPNPFSDSNRFTSKESLLKSYSKRKEPFATEKLTNPFISKSEVALGGGATNLRKTERKVPTYMPYEAVPVIAESSYDNFVNDSTTELPLESLEVQTRDGTSSDNMMYKVGSSGSDSDFEFLNPVEIKKSTSVDSADALLGPNTKSIEDLHQLSIQSSDTPYPVRGVSLYKDDNDVMKF